MPENSELLDLATKVAGWAAPGEEVEAFVSRSRTTSVRVYQQEIEHLTSAEPSGCGIRVVNQGKQGFAWAGTLDETVLKETLEEARDNATFGQPDEFNGLATPDGVAAADLDLWRDELVDAPTATKIDLAMELERAVLGGDPRIKGVRIAAYSDGVGETAVATSTGLAASERGTYCVLQVQSLAEADGETQTGFGAHVARTLADLDMAKTVRDAVERSTRMLGSKKPASQRLTVILDPMMTAQLLSIIGSTLSGESVLKGRSLFANRLGEEVASPVVSLVDDPTDARDMGAALVDGEGLACRRNSLIEDGVLKMFLQNTYSGRRSGSGSTASAVRGYSSTPSVGDHALKLVPGTKSQAELMAEVGDGLVVQSMAGLHSGVNPISGDFSVGAEGVMFRDGAAAEPVREMTIASTLQRMLKDVVAVGGDLEWMPSGGAGMSLVIRDVSLGGS